MQLSAIETGVRKYTDEVKDLILNQNYVGKYLETMKKDEGIVNSGIYKELENMDIYNQALNARYYYVSTNMFENVMPSFDKSDINVRENSSVNVNAVKFLNDSDAKKDYNQMQEKFDILSQELSSKFASLSESSFTKSGVGLDKTNSYSGEKLNIIDGFGDSMYNAIIKESDKINSTLDKKEDKDLFLSEVNSKFSEINSYFLQTQRELNSDLVKNDMKDTSIVDVNTYGLDEYNTAAVIENTEKIGVDYIKKEWLSSEVYQNFEAEDMSDKYKYGSMDKNTQFSNAMKFADIMGIDKESQNSQQFMDEAKLFNEVYYSGLDYVTDSFNLSVNLNNMTDETAIDMAKDFFGDDFSNIVPTYGEVNKNIGFNRDNLKEYTSIEANNMLEFVSNKDEMQDAMQDTQEYISNIEYLDKNREKLELLEADLDTGTTQENYEALTKYNLALEENERDREELLKYFDTFVEELEKNGVIDEYEDYNQKDSLPKSVSPILGKSIYA
jgi:hypothetical protein